MDGHKDVVQILLDNGANIEHQEKERQSDCGQSKYGNTALMWAGK